jgi:O-acetyl-ADP-ribose deacetylase (regulator of RNase III)
VIHTVGPVWQGGDQGEAELLRGCYLSALWLATQHGIRSVAFPAISTGAYGYPVAAAAGVAVEVVREQVRGSRELELVRFVCFGESDWDVYLQLLGHRRDA